MARCLSLLSSLCPHLELSDAGIILPQCLPGTHHPLVTTDWCLLYTEPLPSLVTVSCCMNPQK